MIETGAMMGAEESGGYGFGMHLPERDGIYADLMLLDLFLREKARGVWPVSTRSWPGSMSSPGRRSTGGSTSTSTVPSTTRSKRRLLVDLKTHAPADARRATGRAEPGARRRTTATKFFVDDGSWLLVRASGTEPLVRVYTEATSAPMRDAMLAAGERLVRGS